jgi:hypothetical protein
MKTSVFVSMCDQKMASLIERANARIAAAMPAVRQETARALRDAVVRLGHDKVAVVLDCDEEVFRLGYGDVEAAESLIAAGCRVRQSSGLRIGVLVCDDLAWVFAPTALYVQSEVHSDETPNAIALRASDVDRIVARLVPTERTSVEGNVEPEDVRQEVEPATVEIGHEVVSQGALDQTHAALKLVPPLPFDIARQVRVFVPYIQYVELSLRGCSIQRHRIDVPKSMQGIAPSAELASRLRTTFQLIEKSSDLSSKALEQELNEIRDDLTVSLGKPWGRVILRSSRPRLDERIGAFRQRLEAHKTTVVQSLAKRLEDSCEQLIDHFSALVESAPPDALLGQIATPKPTMTQIRRWLQDELGRVFPKPKELINEMMLDVQFRDVTYETLTEKGFAEKLREAYPLVDWDKPFAEFDAARERDPEELVQSEYLDAKRFPITTQLGLTLHQQKMIDAHNLDELKELTDAGRPLNQRQEAALKELQEKLRLCRRS